MSVAKAKFKIGDKVKRRETDGIKEKMAWRGAVTDVDVNETGNIVKVEHPEGFESWFREDMLLLNSEKRWDEKPKTKYKRKAW